MELKFSSTDLIMPLERIERVGLRRKEAAARRSFFASEEVHALLKGGEAAAQAGFPDFRASALIDAFISGTSVSASIQGGQGNAEFKRLKGLDEVWAVCFRRVKTNQWRILGRFTKKDMFVGLSIHQRSDLAGRAYAEKGRAVIARWDRCFHNAAPFRAQRVDEYLSNARDADDTF